MYDILTPRAFTLLERSVPMNLQPQARWTQKLCVTSLIVRGSIAQKKISVSESWQVPEFVLPHTISISLMHAVESRNSIVESCGIQRYTNRSRQ